MVGQPKRAVVSVAFVAMVGLHLSSAAAARADELCPRAAETAQSLRSAGSFSAARSELLVCANEHCPKVVRRDCLRWLAEVDAAMPSVVFRARTGDAASASDVTDVRVYVDGARVVDRLDGRAIPVDPGSHLFRYVAADGRAAETRMLVVEGEQHRVLELDLGGAHSTPPTAPSAEEARARISPLAWGLGGLAVAGVAAFGVLTLTGTSDFDHLRDGCGRTGSCTAGQVDGARAQYIAADVSLGVGVAALATACVARPRETGTGHEQDGDHLGPASVGNHAPRWRCRGHLGRGLLMAPHRDDASTILVRKRLDPVVSASSFRVTVTEGPDQGATLAVDGSSAPRLLVGQSQVCHLRLTDRKVSRRHVALEASGPVLRIFDLDSSNGTYVNGVSVGVAHLHGGESVSLGDTVLSIERTGSSIPVALPPGLRFGRMIGASSEMRRMYPLCRRLAAAEIPVLIEGETGTGKEVLAEALHDASLRRERPFVVFDCAAVAPTLLESALFGHERGAFTGAANDKRGVFEEANGGTLLIDEIGELDLSLQPKLLRVLERGEVQRIGSNKWRKVDARVLAATRRDLDQEVAAGRFRDDLFFRLAVARVELPPLRRRTGDITVLARHFWHELGGDAQPLPPRLLERFEAYSWPGNVRELHNSVARYLVLGDLDLRRAGERLQAEASPTSTSAVTAAPVSSAGSGAGAGDLIERVLADDLPLARARALIVDEFERRYVERVLERHGGNVVRAAAASGIARRYFQILRARFR